MKNSLLTTDQLIYYSLDDAKNSIQDSDLLLFRKNNAISMVGRGVHSHAAKAVWWDDRLFCLEVREFFGGRAVTLQSQVERYPSRIDVFKANADDRWKEYNRKKAVDVMKLFAGCYYGYFNVFQAALTHIPFLRWRCKPKFNDSDLNSLETTELSFMSKFIKYPPFCSEACVVADRLGGSVDPVPYLADRFVEPADLARSPFYRYMMTLIP